MLERFESLFFTASIASNCSFDVDGISARFDVFMIFTCKL
jgi:hypothetical protein